LICPRQYSALGVAQVNSVLSPDPSRVYQRQKGNAMKIENIREVKTRFSRYVKELPKSGSVLITRNGRPCAALVPVTEDTDLEALALSQNKRFWKLIDDAIARGKKEGFVDLADLRAPRLASDFPKRLRDRRAQKVKPL
jgi:prevent-host-death family protein